jgi:hypothetical protein
MQEHIEQNLPKAKEGNKIILVEAKIDKGCELALCFAKDGSPCFYYDWCGENCYRPLDCLLEDVVAKEVSII